jgi:predicted dithiol-disulfide oxidoreductase (DUF899 family)
LNHKTKSVETPNRFNPASSRSSNGDPGQDPRAQGTIEPFWNMLDLMPGGRGNFEEQLQYHCCDQHGVFQA